jgi:TatD DNase family protein
MEFIDTHCHLYLKEFREEWAQLIERAENVGVKQFYLPGIDAEEIENILEMEAKFPGKCFAMAGLHPCSVKQNYREELSVVESWLGRRRFAAVGEIGLDFHWDTTYTAQQYEVFNRQIEWALHYDRPIVIHSRKATAECIAVVRLHQKGKLRGVFHCFSGDAAQAKEAVELGFYLGIGGVITYKNAGLAEAIANIPLAHLVLETDAPYLSPVPHRGKRNESSYLRYVVQKLAELYGVSGEEIGRVTTENARKLFE